MLNRALTKLRIAVGLAAWASAGLPALAQGAGAPFPFQVFSCSVEISMRSNVGPILQEVTLIDDTAGRRLDISSQYNITSTSVASYTPQILHLFVAPDLFELVRGYALHSTQIQAGITVQPQTDGSYKVTDAVFLTHDPVAARCPVPKATP